MEAMVPPAELDFEIPSEFPSRVPRVGGGAVAVSPAVRMATTVSIQPPAVWVCVTRLIFSPSDLEEGGRNNSCSYERARSDFQCVARASAA